MVNCNLENWTKNCEQAVNKQIQLEYWASYQYHLMWSYFDRSSVGLNNIAEFFKKSSLEERDHAHQLMEYQNLRGGSVELTGIDAANLDFLKDSDKSDVLLAFEKTLEMEQIVYKSLVQLHEVAEAEYDAQFADFVEGKYLEEQVEALNEISKYISQLERIGNDGHGVWNFDREFKN